MASLVEEQQRIDAWIEDAFILYDEPLGFHWRQQRFYLIDQDQGEYFQSVATHSLLTEPNHNALASNDAVMEFPDDARPHKDPGYTWRFIWPEAVDRVMPCSINCYNFEGQRPGKGWYIDFAFQYTNADRSVDRWMRSLSFTGASRGGSRVWTLDESEVATPTTILNFFSNYMREEGYESAVIGRQMLLARNGTQWLLDTGEIRDKNWPSTMDRATIRDLLHAIIAYHQHTS